MDDQPKSFFLSAPVHRYIVEHGSPPDPVQRDLIARTAELGEISVMQISPEEGALLTLLVRILDARFAVEIGTFTGYSALCIAKGLGDGGRLLTCDTCEEWTAIARSFWHRAGVADRIDLHLAPALETLGALPMEPRIDFAFVDANKDEYIEYYEALLPRMRPGGLLAIDNVLWSGLVAESGATDAATVAIRAFNDRVVADDRVETVIIPVADGLSLIRVVG